MGDDPSNAELARQVGQLSVDMKDGFRTIDSRLAAYLPRESHAIHVDYTAREFRAQEQAIKYVKAELLTEITDLKADLHAVQQNRTDGIWRSVTVAISVLSLLASVAVGLVAVFVK